MYRVKLVSYPNDENRVTIARLPPAKPENYGDILPLSIPGDAAVDAEQNESLSLLDIRSELETLPWLVENCWNKPSKPGWGDLPTPTKFGLTARRTILRVGGVIDSIAESPSEALFLTGTIPNGYDDGRITTAAYSAWFVHSLKAWVNKYVPAKFDFYVWEYQKRGVLHLHYAVHVPDTTRRRFIKETFREQWVRLLLRLSQDVGVDLCFSDNGRTDKTRTDDIQAYSQEVHTSATAYLSKYMSKGGDYYCRVPDRVLYPPTRWWGVSRPLLKALEEATFTNELITTSQREALTLYGDIATLLESTSEKAYSYASKYSFAFTTAAYQTAYNGIEQCLITMNSQNHSKSLNASQSYTELIPTYLRAIAQRFTISPAKFSTQYTQSAGQAMEKLFNGAPLNIIEAMEITDGLVWLLWYLYPNRGRTHDSYQRAVDRLMEIKQYLMEAYQDKGNLITTPLTEIC